MGEHMVTDRKRFITGMTGVYAAAAELSAKGFIVTITARNAPGVDIMASTPDLKETFNIQVKANKPKGTQSFWLLNKDAQQIVSSNFVYVFVNLKEEQKPDFYTVGSAVVARDMNVSHSKSGHWYFFRRDAKYKNWDALRKT
jgi:hypothetical protein